MFGIHDKPFYSSLIKIGVPITIQFLITNLSYFLDLMMVGQLNETSIAGMGLANQIYFLVDLLLFGTSSGSAILSAHYWGQEDVHGVKRTLAACFLFASAGALLFSVAGLICPDLIIRIYSGDPAVIQAGSIYLRTIALAFIPMAITGSLAYSLRSTGNARLPMMVNAAALALDVFLNYTLIFGRFGFPAFGIQGAAIGSTIARTVEAALLLALAYLSHTTAAIHLHDFIALDGAFIKKIVQIAFPVALNESVWSLGQTIYRVVYAHIGTEAVAAINICTTIEELVFVPFIAITLAGAVMIGHQVGAGDHRNADIYARRLILMTFIGSIIGGVVLVIFTPYILTLYRLNDITAGYLQSLLVIFAFILCIRMGNMIVFVGIIRAGGDTRYSLKIEMLTMWLIGVPFAFLGAFVLHLSVPWVYFLVMMEEVIKFFIGIRYYKTKRWIHDLVGQPAQL